MASANFVVSSLPAYVEQHRDVLLKNFGLVGGETRKRISIQTGIKKDAAINFLDLTPALQSGVACEFTPSGAATLTQRVINTAEIKVNMDICPRNLVGKYAEYLVRINATEQDLPFEKYIVDGVIAEVNKKIEKLIWQGDTENSSSSFPAELKFIDGFLKIADDDATEITVSGTTAYENLVTLYNGMSEEALERGGCIFVAPAIYREFLQDLVSANLYHYSSANEAYPDEYYLPGTDVKVVKTPGLAGTTKAVATFAANLFYGCDMENDSENIDLWYSKDDRVFKLEVLWNSGVQIAFPDHAVWADLA